MAEDLSSAPAPLDDESARAIADAMAPMLGLVIDPDWSDGVIQHLKTNARAAGLILEFPLDDELEPAGVFRL